MRVLKAIGLISFGVMLGVGGALQAAAGAQKLSPEEPRRLTTGKMEYATDHSAFRFLRDTVTGQCYILAYAEGGVSAITPTASNACTF